MGTIGKIGEKQEYTESEIQKYLRCHFMTPNGAKYQIENLFVYRWESDYLHVTKSGYSYEVEIKISRSDFFNDKKKIEKHQILENKYELKSYEKEQPDKPNYFYYAVPRGLVKPEEIPSYAGLIYIDKIWPYVHIEVTAPKLHGNKIDEDKLNLKDKFYYNYIQWKDKAENKYKQEIEMMKGLITEAKTDETTGIKYKHTIAEANELVNFLDNQLKQKEKEIDRLYEDNRIIIRENIKLREKLMEFGLTIEDIQKIQNGE